MQAALERVRCLEEGLCVRSAVLVVGPPLVGKTALWKLLQTTLTAVAEEQSAGPGLAAAAVADHVRSVQIGANVVPKYWLGSWHLCADKGNVHAPPFCSTALRSTNQPARAALPLSCLSHSQAVAEQWVQVLPEALGELALFGGDADSDGEQKGALWHLLQPSQPLAEAAMTAQALSRGSGHAGTVPVPACGRRWLVLDGSMQGPVADRVMALLHGQKISLGQGQEVSIPSNHRLLWECTSLTAASPALLAHVGICALEQPLLRPNALLCSLAAEIKQEHAQLDVVRTAHPALGLLAMS